MRVSTLRTSPLVWLLDFEWGDQVYRVAEQDLAAPTGPLGESREYRAGLDVADYEDAIGSVASAPAYYSVSVTASLAGLLDVPARVADGWDLQLATARLLLFAIDGDERDVREVLVGRVREPEYGAAEEPITFSISEDADAPRFIPDIGARYDIDTWPSGGSIFAPELDGERYPIIFGRPGGGTEDASLALQVSAALMLIADRPVDATSVTIYDADDDLEESFPVIVDDDGRGRQVSVVNVSGAATITVTTVAPFWVRWDDGGGTTRAGSEVRGAGDVLRWMLAASGARFDEGRTTAALPLLAGYLIDAAITATPDARIAPLDWVRDHLLPVLPMSLRVGPDGLYPVVWRWDATAADVVATIDADLGRAARETAVSCSDRADVANDFSLRYLRNARLDRHMAVARLTGDPAESASGVASNIFCRRSVSRYGVVQSDARSDVIADAATARAVLLWMARRHALPSRVCRWSVDRSLGWLEPGAVVRVEDAEVGISAIGIAESVTLRTSGDFSIAVRFLDSPQRGE